MNLRDIKKDIQYVVGAFIDDCTLFLNMNPGKNTDALYDELSACVKNGLGK